MKEGLLRQRRNLIAISAVLTLFDFAKVSIGEVSVLGTNLVVGEPRVLYFFAWLLWGYFLLRYTQYLSDEDDLGLRSRYLERVANRVETYLRRSLEEMYPKNRYQNVSYARMARKGFLKWELPLEAYDVETSSVVLERHHQVPPRTLLLTRLNATAYVIFVTPRVTDFVLPFLLAALAPAVTLWPEA